MKFRRALGLSTLLALAAGVNCGGDEFSEGCKEGGEGCPCFENSTCNQGLSCLSDVCVDASGSGGSGGSSRCAPGQTSCDGTCVDLSSDDTNCGDCGTRCMAGEACAGGECTCQAGREPCDGTCVDNTSDPEHCGACNVACSEDEVCSDSECATGCASDLTQCGRTCVDTNVSVEHCGGCDSACVAGQSCSDGECACPSDEELCSDECVNTNDDVQHCGACGSACLAGEVCDGGECACPANRERCGALCVPAGSCGSGGAGGSAPTGGSGGSGPTGGSGGSGATGGSGLTGGGGTGGNPGGGGTTATGGSGNASGAGGSGGGTVSCASTLALDNMEDGNNRLCMTAGRSGDWWIDCGGSGSVVPAAKSNFGAVPLGANARPGSNYGMRMQGSGFASTTSDWASLGFNFISQQVTYDVTPYQGFTFWAKVTSGSLSVRVNLGVPGTVPTSLGGTCTVLCHDHYHVTVTVGTTWQLHQVSFAALAQEGWGPAPKDLAHAMYVYFAWGPPNPSPFDLWIDDLTFY